MSITSPGAYQPGQDEECGPHVVVGAWMIGEAAEILALVAAAAAAEPAIRPRWPGSWPGGARIRRTR